MGTRAAMILASSPDPGDDACSMSDDGLMAASDMSHVGSGLMMCNDSGCVSGIDSREN